MLTLVYFILAALGLSFLVFIHEMGHYVMARRVGMRVEVFSIGFGKAFFSWEHKGVKWQVCYLLFGGYVKIAGMEKEGDKEPHEIEDGFFGRSPLDRIKVAIMGPLVNIVFTFFIFSMIYISGGREQEFHQQTNLIGYIDPSSELFEKGVRAGDSIRAIDGHAYNNFMDINYSSVSSQETVAISGNRINYATGEQSPYSYTLKPYANPYMAGGEFKTVGVLAPANYLIYGGYPIPETAPMASSGIEKGDRIVWVDGERIFSLFGLQKVIKRPESLLTIQRGDEQFLQRVPRLKVGDLRLSREQTGEFDDWQHEIGLKGELKELTFIPYSITPHCVIEGPLTYLDNDSRHQTVAGSLERGDRILAVDGQEVVSAFQLLGKIQKRKVQIIVSKESSMAPFSWLVQDKRFEEGFGGDDLAKLVATIGVDQGTRSIGRLRLLNPVTPVEHMKFPRTNSRQKREENLVDQANKKLDAIKDPKERAAFEKKIEEYVSGGSLGIAFVDHNINYNPSPLKMCEDILLQMKKTFTGLFTGELKPKWLSGPVGIVTIMHQSWSLGINEALYWMGLISLNLGILNLLPIPVLDGGHISFSLYEMITRRKIKSSAMEKMVIPFVVLLLLFFVYVTFQDISRLITLFK